jgi:hypothetical protein
MPPDGIQRIANAPDVQFVDRKTLTVGIQLKYSIRSIGSIEEMAAARTQRGVVSNSSIT